MKRLTSLIAPALAVSMALGIAAPASASPWQNQNSLRSEIVQLDRQIERAMSRNQISYRDGVTLQRKVDQIEKLRKSYARNGFNRAEIRILDQRIDNVKRDIDRQIRKSDNRRDNYRNNQRGRDHHYRGHDWNGRGR